MERLYMVMTNSPYVYDNRILARVEPQKGFRVQTHWTDKPGAAWRMDRETAEVICRNLSFNNPRVVRAEKGDEILARNFA